MVGSPRHSRAACYSNKPDGLTAGPDRVRVARERGERRRGRMRIESSITAVTWIPSEAIEGMPKLPFELGVAHYDDPPPDTIENLDKLHEADAFREANELRAWIEVQGGRIVDHGNDGRGLIGVTRLKLGRGRLAFPAVQFPL